MIPHPSSAHKLSLRIVPSRNSTSITNGSLTLRILPSSTRSNHDIPISNHLNPSHNDSLRLIISTPSNNRVHNYYWREAHQSLSHHLWLPSLSNSTVTSLDPSDQSSKKILTNSWFSVTQINSDQSTNLLVDSSFTSSDETSCLRMIKYHVHLSPQLERNIQHAMHAVRFLYNKCVELCCKQEPRIEPKLSILRPMLLNKKSSKNILPSEIKEDLEKVPYAIRDEALRDFTKAIKIQKQLVAQGKKRHFEMHFRKKRSEGSTQSIVIRHQKINVQNDKIYCFTRIWKKQPMVCKSENIIPIKHDCRLLWTRDNRYYLVVPVDVSFQLKLPTHKVVAIDPNAENFIGLYDSSGEAMVIGSGDMDKLDEKVSKAANVRNGWKRIWTSGDRVLRPERTVIHNGRVCVRKARMVWRNSLKSHIRTKKKKHLKKLGLAADKIMQTVKNKTADLHRKITKYVCTEYDTVIIPKFRTQKMVKRKDEDGDWIRKISKETSRQLLNWSHYKFRELLRAKGEVTGTNIVIGTESWSSKTCSNCLRIKHDLGWEREYRCNGCKGIMHRDVNAGRNIMMMNWERAKLRIRN